MDTKMIKTVGELREILNDLDDDYKLDIRIMKEIPEKELIGSSYPYPMEMIDGYLEFQDIGYSDKELCIGVYKRNGDKNMKNSKAAKILRDFANKDMESLDNRVREYTGDVNNTEKRIKALNRAADFLDGKEDFSNKKLDKMFDILDGIKYDYKAFKEDLFVNTEGNIKKALNTAMDEIAEILYDKEYDYER